jgi:two-component system sensor histidine kinase SenX3
MPFPGPLRQRATTLAAVVLAILLPLLAILQYRWIGEVSQAERERLRAAPDHFAEDFDRELTRAFLSFQPAPPAPGTASAPPTTNAKNEGTPGRATAERRATLVRQARRWRIEAPVPQLLRALYIVEEGKGGALELSRLDAVGDRFVPVPWPADLAALERRLSVDGSVPPIDGEDAVLVLPLSHTFMDESGEGRGHVLLQLDRDFIAGSLLPSLAERWFQVSNEPQALVAVRSPQGIVYRSDHTVPSAQFLPGDMTIPMFGLRRIESLHGLVPGGFSPAGGSPTGSGPNAGREPSSSRFRPTGPHRHGMGGGTWTLVVTHPAGSLEAAVTRARRRNLAVSFGAIALVAASLIVMAFSVQRARLLARQQLELVAGITHELNTPLAAIRSAGQNLADGVVAEGGQVRRYGALIEREGARLSGMVGKALELAGIQSGHRAYRPEAVAVPDVVAEALEDGRFLFAEHQIEVDSRIAPGLPAVWADREALRMALVNLLDNAVKYAGSGRFIAVRAALERGGRQVSLTVEDRGPGIRAEDRRHLFEPFYRGREVAAAGVPGSGLGLSLVRRIAESQRGTVSFAAGPGGKGSAFTLHLPAAPQVRVAEPASGTERMGEAL